MQSLKPRGVARMSDNDKAVLVMFDRKPSDSEIRLLHEQEIVAEPSSAGWVNSRGYGDIEDRTVGGFRLSITNQSDRGCGWCWHVATAGEYGENIAQGGTLASADEAKAKAESWVRDLCASTLVALGAKGSA